MRWVSTEREAIEGKISAFPAAAVEARLAVIDYAIQSPVSDIDSTAAISRFAAALTGVRVGLSARTLDEARIRRYLETCTSILTAEQIHEEHAGLGLLALELKVLKFQLLLRQADWDRALWLGSKLVVEPRLRQQPAIFDELSLSLAVACLRLGQVHRAHKFATAASSPLADNIRWRCQLLLGDAERAFPAAREQAFDAIPNSHIDFHAHGWLESFHVFSSLSGRSHRAWIRSSNDPNLYLWTIGLLYAFGQISSINQIAKLRTRARDRAFRALTNPSFVQSLMIIEECYDVTRPVRHRIDRLEAMLSHIHRLPAVEMELIVLTASSRWLARIGQTELAESLQFKLQSLGHELADGFKERAGLIKPHALKEIV
jgi:hypothetical protein